LTGLSPFQTFAQFRDHLVETVERMNSGLVGPDATWPGVLFLEVPEQGVVVGEMRSMAGLSEWDKRELACRLLPTRIPAKRKKNRTTCGVRYSVE
jgi:hypothetical protein